MWTPRTSTVGGGGGPDRTRLPVARQWIRLLSWGLFTIRFEGRLSCTVPSLNGISLVSLVRFDTCTRCSVHDISRVTDVQSFNTTELSLPLFSLTVWYQTPTLKSWYRKSDLDAGPQPILKVSESVQPQVGPTATGSCPLRGVLNGDTRMRSFSSVSPPRIPKAD